MSEKQWFSPREIVTGLTVDYKRDYNVVVGTYTEDSIGANITNNNVEHQQSCVYLEPSENRQGFIKHFIIDTGAVIVRHIFDVFPYSDALLKK